jgi:predicted ribosome quality control (RQC) complex YloA/Tae2 family protein
MKTKERSIYLLIIIALASGFYYLTFYKDLEYIDIYRQEIDALDAKIDSLHSENDHLTITIDSLNTEITALDQEIDAQDDEIEKIREKADEEITAVDTFTPSQLTDFFTDRYGYLFSSPAGADSTGSN